MSDDNRLPTNQSQLDIEAALQDVKNAIANLNFILNAQNIAYDSNTSVKNKIDEIDFKESIITPNYADITINYSKCIQIDKLVLVDVLFTSAEGHGSANRLLSGLPSTISNDNFQFWGVEVKAYPNFSTTPWGFRIYNSNGTGGIYSNVGIPAGQFHVYGMYITT